jgi:tetratricopeptide (TPR) repeat protein
LLTTVSALAQPRWIEDFDAALAAAREADGLVLVVATVGSRCRACRALEAEVFGAKAHVERLGGGLVRCRLVYTRRQATGADARALFAARAQLRGYPTVYLVDAAGWPLFAQHGYEPGRASELVDRVVAARADRARVARGRSASDRAALRALLRWYAERDLPLGQTLVAGRLYEGCDGEEQARYAPRLVAPAIVESGAAGAEPYLRRLRGTDPRGERGLLPEGLHRAGSQLLRGGDFPRAIALLRELAALERAPIELRRDAEMSLGYAERNRGDLRRAIAHYERAVALSEEADPEGGCCPWRAQAARRVASLRRQLEER